MGSCNTSTNCNPCGPDFNAINQLATRAGAYARQANRYSVDAQNAWLEFNALYLGAFAAAPTVDNEGNPLQVGALYWNSVSNTLFIWDGAAWGQASNFSEVTNFLSLGSPTPRNLVTRTADTVNVLDYGADPTGATDSSAALQAAFNAATNGKSVYIPSGTYTCTSTINVQDCSEISGYGATLDFSAAVDATRLRIHGSIGSNILLTANANKGSNSVAVSSTAGLAAGDLILISSNQLVPLAALGGSTTETIGEFAVIQRIVGSNLIINGALDDTYTTATVAKIQKVTPKENITVAGLTIIGAGPSGLDVSTNDIGINALYCRNLHVENCKLVNCDYNAIRLDQCYESVVNGNTIIHGYRGSDSFLSVIQYGIVALGATASLSITNNCVIGGKHAIDWSENVLPGVGRNVVVSHNYLIGTWAGAIATHETNEQFTIIANYISGCNNGLDIRVRRGVISNNTIREVGQGTGIQITESASDLVIDNNNIYNARFGIRMPQFGMPNNARPFNIRITNNVISNIDQQGIILEQTLNSGNFRNWVISGNTIKECVGDSIRLNGGFYSPTITNNVIKNFNLGVGYGVNLKGTTRAQIQGNYFENVVPVRLENDTQTVPVEPTYSIIINNIWDHTSAFASVAAGSNFIFRGNTQIGDTTQFVVSGDITAPSGIPQLLVDELTGPYPVDLNNIFGGMTGDIMVVRTASSARDITLKDGVGNLRLAGDFTLDHVDDRICLINTGVGWAEVSRSNNT
jgi:hypothetical protein